MEHVLVILGIPAGAALFVFCSPTKPCTACARHRGPCLKCKGTGRRFRIGARLVRRGVLVAGRHGVSWIRDAAGRRGPS